MSLSVDVYCFPLRSSDDNDLWRKTQNDDGYLITDGVIIWKQVTPLTGRTCDCMSNAIQYSIYVQLSRNNIASFYISHPEIMCEESLNYD